MKKIILTLGGVIALMLSGLTAATATASAAAPGDTLRIVRVGTDAMGTDTYANRNREYVTFMNVSSDSVDINGVVVEDNWSKLARRSHSCNTYKITDLPGSETTMLAPRERVTVYNGQRFGGDYKTSDGEYRLYANSDVDCGTAGHFLNNDADTVWVTRGSEVFDSKSWDWNGGYYVFGRR